MEFVDSSLFSSNVRYRGKRYSPNCDDAERRDSVTDYSCFMNDKEHSIDFVLVNYTQDESISNFEQRRMFEQNVLEEGLVLEPFVDIKNMLRYIKIHVPWETLSVYAELLKYNMPIMKNDLSKTRHQLFYGSYVLPPIEQYFTAPFSISKLKYFHIVKRETFFNQCQRSSIVVHILNQFGLQRLSDQKVYIAGYPLHSGSVHGDGIEHQTGLLNLRCRLYLAWGRFACFFYPQPIDHIRLYFGEMTGFFFALVGLYTTMLMPLSVIGISVFIYGLVNMVFKEAVNEICDVSASGNITMCPLCVDKCAYWKLREVCNLSKSNAIFDNNVTIVYAIATHIWSTVFLERWKSYEATLIQSWSMNNYTTKDVVRYQYINNASKRQTNPVTGYEEYVMETKAKCMRLTVSICFVLVWLAVAVISVTFVNRLHVGMFLSLIHHGMHTDNASLLSSLFATVFFIFIFNLIDIIFLPLARFFTTYETPRIRRDWEKSYTVKTVVFRLLVNVMYIAYFAFPLVTPEKPGNPYNALRLEMGSNITLFILGKQIIAVAIIIAKEKLLKVLSPFELSEVTRMQADYKLLEFSDEYLIDEYIGFLLQYTMLLCFGPIFPFIAVCAFVNNMVLIRLSAYRMLNVYRRPVGRRRNGIGNWLTMLKVISRVSRVITSVSLVYWSEFIENTVYTYLEQKEHYGNAGFVEFSLSIANVSRFNAELKGVFINETVCRYRDFRQPPNGTHPYTPTSLYYKVQSFKFLFIIVFNVIVELFSSIVYYFISGVKKSVRLQQLREAYLNQKVLLESNS